MELFKIGFLTVSIKDIIDIAVISYLTYKVYLIMRGTRAYQMLIGLIFILLASFLAQALNMSGMSWLFNSISTVWVVAFVIIFQPELRRLLIYAGQSRVVRLFVRVEENVSLIEVTKAAIELSKRRYGGIIVLQRDAGLRSVIETGVSIQSKVSEALIVTLFSPRSPLHDGAVIIANDLVEAAKCILPLSDSPDLDPSLGTRHRAALGLSEESDAVIVVVSEETGIISIAKDGKLTRGYDYNSLLKTLQGSLKVQVE
mgnify:CR=1 FL=1